MMQTRKRKPNENNTCATPKYNMNFDISYQMFLDLMEHHKIKSFLEKDTCKIIADKYILAGIFIYFIKAKLSKCEYNQRNFYLALYLIHDLEEDVEEYKDEIVDSCLGPLRKNTKHHHGKFLRDRFAFFERIKFDGTISRQVCDILIAKSSHWVWERTRHISHSGSFNKYFKCRKC